jgi:hypothetical protein
MIGTDLVLSNLIRSCASHWMKKVSTPDFRSGLGDSAWLLYGSAARLT